MVYVGCDAADSVVAGVSTEGGTLFEESRSSMVDKFVSIFLANDIWSCKEMAGKIWGKLDAGVSSNVATVVHHCLVRGWGEAIMVRALSS